jgi:hypothetical protein
MTGALAVQDLARARWRVGEEWVRAADRLPRVVVLSARIRSEGSDRK